MGGTSAPFETPISYAGEVKMVQFLLREDNNGHWYYNHESTETKKALPVSLGGTSGGTQTTPAIGKTSTQIIDTPGGQGNSGAF